MQNPNSIIPLMSLLRIEADFSTPFRATLGPLTRGGHSRGPVTLKTLLLGPSVRCFPTFPRHAPTRLVTKNTSTQISIQTTLSKKIPHITDETTSPSPSHPHHYQNGKDKRPGNRAFLYFTFAFTYSSLITQTPLEKAHIIRAEKKKRREEIKAKRLAILKAAREKKAKAKKA